MNKAVTIENEISLKGNWLKVYMPHPNGKASILDKDGSVIKKVSLNEGQNAIDISNINNQKINIKIETAFETILKEVKLNHQ